MILTCPSCGTQYVVKDGAIPPEGRQVRCAACKHSWHQDPEAAEADAIVVEPNFENTGPEAEGAVETQPAVDTEAPAEEVEPQDEENLAEATLIDPRSGPEAEERAYEEAAIEAEVVGPDADQPLTQPEAAVEQAGSAEAAPKVEEDWNEPPHAEAAPDMFSPFAPDEEEPRRRSPIVTIAIIVLVLIVLAVLFWLFAPLDLKARLGLAEAGATPLQLVTTHMDRTPLESGQDLLTVTGRVINPSSKPQNVPPIQARLKNRNGEVVKSWTIQPPTQLLAGGASASFNSAEVNVPKSADELTISLGEPKA
jgi:predicted Zn finger-like uncharacterized protein